MPLLLKKKPTRGWSFKIVALDCDERMHVHVTRGKEDKAKIWLDDLSWSWARNLKSQEIRQIQEILEKYHDELKKEYFEFCFNKTPPNRKSKKRSFSK